MNDPFELSRFLVAQDDTYNDALRELRQGKKTGHWMWFVFPQVTGLGDSEMSNYYSIASVDEAVAYMARPILGPRLIECASLVTDTEDRTAEQVFGPVDAMKFRSSMTLFGELESGHKVFQRALDQYFDGVPDPNTLRFLAGA